MGRIVKYTLQLQKPNPEDNGKTLVTQEKEITKPSDMPQRHFIRQLLSDIDESEIESYAEDILDMIKEDEIGTSVLPLSRFPEYDLIDEIEGRGYVVIPCKTIIDALVYEKFREVAESGKIKDLFEK